MNAKKKILFALGSIAVLVLAFVILGLTFDINSYRSRIEAAVSEAIGLDVSIKGKMGLSFFPFGISAQDIRVSNKGHEILSLESLKLGAELLPLLRKQLKVTACELVKPAITIVKEANGNYNYERPEKEFKEEQQGASFTVKYLKVSKGTLIHHDKKTGEITEFKVFSIPHNCFPHPK